MIYPPSAWQAASRVPVAPGRRDPAPGEHGFGRDVVELLLAHSEKNATVAAYSHMELAAERKRALQFLADRVEALAAGMNVIPLRAA